MRGRLSAGGLRRAVGPAPAPASRAAGALLLAAFGVVFACGAPEPEPHGLSDSLYVAVMARLTAIDRDLARRAPERADSARSAVLARHGVSSEALRAYAARHGDDPGHLVEIWRAIEAKADTLLGTASSPDLPTNEAEDPEAPGPEAPGLETPDPEAGRSPATSSLRRG